MGETTMKRTKQSKVNRSNKRRLTKAQAAVTIAKRNVAIATKRLGEAVRALLGCQAGSSKEVRSAKAVRAATKGLVAARKKQRKAERKRKKAAARLLKASARGKLTAAKRRAARAAGRRQAVSVAPR